jgi:hypothetical protein
MDRNYINQHLLVDRYLQGDLPEQAVAEFEERLVWDQELVEDVQLAEALRNGMLATQGPGVEATTAGLNDKTFPGAGIAARMRTMIAMPQFALAASVLLVASMVLNFSLMTTPYQQSVAALSPQLIPIETQRNSSVAIISVDSSREIVLLIDAVGVNDCYRVSLLNDNDGAMPFVSQDGLQPGYLDMIALAVPGTALPPGDYTLILEARQEDDELAAYSLVNEIRFRTETTP